MKNNHLCNNCGKYGHLFHQCKLPITSYGIILFRSSESGPKFLMIRRNIGSEFTILLSLCLRCVSSIYYIVYIAVRRVIMEIERYCIRRSDALGVRKCWSYIHSGWIGDMMMMMKKKISNVNDL